MSTGKSLLELGRARFPGLDGLRALAALGVLLHHLEQARFTYGFPNCWAYAAVTRLGSLCVSFFFVLSGFLITWLLLEERRDAGAISIKKFYLRRVLRIWPLYFLIVALGFFVLPHLRAYDFPGDQSAGRFFWEKLLLYVSFSPHVASAVFPPEHYAGVLWSVGVEEWFYLGWPLILLALFRPLGIAAVSFCVIGVLLVIRVALIIVVLRLGQSHAATEEFFRPLLEFFTQLRFDCMAFGALGAVALYRLRDAQAPALDAFLLRPLFSRQMQIVVFSFLALCLLSGKDFFLLDQQVYSVLFLFVIVNVGANRETMLRFDNGVLRHLGKISYGIYCFNWIAIVAAIGLVRWMFTSAESVPAQVSLQLLAIALTILAAQLSYWILERPFLALKTRPWAA